MPRHLLAPLLMALLAAIVLGGCGQKGPLYLPDRERPAASTR